MSNKKEIKIKPCKICGTKAVLVKVYRVCGEGYHVECGNLPCDRYIGLVDKEHQLVFSESEKEAIKYWNKHN